MATVCVNILLVLSVTVVHLALAASSITEVCREISSKISGSSAVLYECKLLRYPDKY